MTDEELRALVRDAVARHLDGRSTVPRAQTAHDPRRHASHAMFAIATGADDDGPCVIEPAVLCTHCGYCKSYGH
jgi:hypothetical protein